MAKHKKAQPTVAEDTAAFYIGYTTATLRAWRRLRKGPPYLRAGRSIRYRISDLDTWQTRHRVEPEHRQKTA